MGTRSPLRRRVVVVGSGIAGLTAALHASEHHDVVLVTGGALEAANTAWAQGGIAGVLADPLAPTGDVAQPRDSVASHIADTLSAGAGLGDEDAIRVLCSEAPDRLRELVTLGVPFDRTEGDRTTGRLARALEAAHSAPRILHAGGDATGAAIERVLAAAARVRVPVIREHTRLVDILLRDGAVSGVSLDGPDGARIETADAVILATGGFAGLYAHTSNPAFATGSGLAVAARAGAVLADLEFVQFHPSVLAAPGSFLVSEAVRGAGAVLRDDVGERFMLAVHPDAELAPRDVVARAIARRMRERGGRPVLLDATGVAARNGTRLDTRFPGIASRVRAAGYDWNVEPIPVTPAAHYTMGGVATDLFGRTSVPGLFAVGEVARTGVHGANRLASNSLIEGAVFGARAALALSLDDRTVFAPGGQEIAPLSVPGAMIHPVSSPTGFSPSRSSVPSPTLGEILWDEVGLVRDAEGLDRAIQQIDGLVVTDGADADSRVDRDSLTVASLVARAALRRRESRGAHARSDHPATDEALARPMFVRAAFAQPEAAARRDSVSVSSTERVAC